MDLLTRSYDPAYADVRVEFGFARAEFAFHAANRATAEQWSAIAEVIDEARAHPEVFVDPALPMGDSERIEFAQRAAAADLAVRLGLSEATVRAQAFDAQTLRRRLPGLWARFGDGEVAVPNARAAADLVRALPDEVSREFDDTLVEISSLAPARFRHRARILSERIHPIPLLERVKIAAQTRDVWIENDRDGMAELGMRMPAVEAHRAWSRIEAAARDLTGLDGEHRTLAQLRADVAAGVLTGDDTGAPTRVTVAVTVPVMTLLGVSDQHGSLDGYGPIDADTARRLAAHAPSFTRLLTHPVSSVVLDLDRTTYRPPADLKRWLEVTDQTCRFPGCGRRARTSDLDHTIDYQHGGSTSAANLAHLCRHHHRLKHMTRWRVAREPDDDARLSWTSPTGHRVDDRPPPF
jgi:hypothetical protein